MHRSGTSLVAAMLCTAGAEPPARLMPPDANNTAGYWESWPLTALNEELLAELDLSWDSTLTFPSEMLLSPKAQRFVPLYAQLLREEFGAAPLFCTKDPRNSRLLPILLPALMSESIEPKFVVVTRNPLEVAASLKQRDGFHWSKSLMLWLRHTLEAEKNSRGQRRVFITYEELMKDWRGVLRRVGSSLDVSWPRRAADIDVDFGRVISTELRHHSFDTKALEVRSDVSDWVSSIYGACIAASEDRFGEVSETFDSVRRQLAIADAAFEPLFVDGLQRERELADEREIDALRSAAERDEASTVSLSRLEVMSAERDVAREEANAAAGRLAEQQAELTAARDREALIAEQLTALTSNSDALSMQLRDREGEVAAVRADLDRIREELLATAARAEERLARAEALAAEVQQRESDLSAMLAERDYARAEAVSISDDLTGIRNELDAARRLTASATARSAAKQAQIERLFDELRRRDAEWEATKATLQVRQAEAANLESELRIAQKTLESIRAARISDAGSHEAALKAAEDAAEASRAQAILVEEGLNEKLRSMRRLLEASEQSLADVKLWLGASAAQVTQLSRSASQSDADLVAARAELEEVRRASGALKSDVESLEADVAAARVVTETVLEDLGRTQRELALARADAIELRAANSELEIHLKTNEEGSISHRLQVAATAILRSHSNHLSAEHATAIGSSNGHQLKIAAQAGDYDLGALRDGLAAGLCNIADWKIELRDVGTDLGLSGPIGVFVHIYYESIAGEIAAAIRRIPFSYHVHVSTVDETKKATIEALFAREGVSDITVKVLPNLGFDIGPFLFGFRDEIRKHDLCVRLHGKRSSHSHAPFGTEWRRHLLRELLDSADRVEYVVRAFNSNRGLGMLIPNHWHAITDWISIGDNWVWLKWLLDRLDLSIDPGGPIEYPSGSMFWFRSAAIEPLLALDLTPEDFAASNEVNRDSTLAHGVERAFLFASAKAGLGWAFLPEFPRIVEPNIDESIELVRKSGLFDADYYLEKNKDVAATGHDPLDHFMRFGAAERRNPSATFDARFYARLALRDFGWKGNPLVHYLLEGAAKGMPTLRPRREMPMPAITITEDLYAAYKRAERGADYVEESFPLIRPSTIKIMAFYFPQFHPFAENDRFWGRGFTEWTNTTKTQPMFPGHYQPRLPGELGFYDTRVKEVLARQIELAKQYGVHGFCFHHYFFQSKPVMRAPYNQMLKHSDLDIPFCLHWANEPWTVRWDGLASESGMLLDQRHSPEDDLAFFDDIAPALTDKRYIKIDGRPLLIVYRPGLFPDMQATIERWRESCARLGLKDPYLAVMQAWFEGAVDPRKYGFDAAIEYPPHNLTLNDASGLVALYDKMFAGNIYDYAEVVERAVERPEPSFTWFRGLMPQWDCTPRRADPDLFVNCDPQKYQEWLQELCRYTERTLRESERFIFVNSWNEWAEGAYLEPDRRYGYAYLDATARALNGYREPSHSRATLRILLAAHVFYLDLLDEFLDRFDRVPVVFDLLLTVSTKDVASIEERVRARLKDKASRVTIRYVENVGRDGAPFLLHALPESQKYDLCCWMHSKKSPYDTNYAGWRTYLLGNLLESPQAVSAIVEAFSAQDDLGMLFPKPFPAVVGKMEWGSNYVRTSELLSRIGIAAKEHETPYFPQGMMFWFRPKALRRLLEIGLSHADFEADSQGALHSSGTVFDGTLSHALERMVCYVVRAAGFRTREFLNSPYDAREPARNQS